MAQSECPACHAHITANPAWSVDSLIICPECGAELVVTGTSPLELELAEEDLGPG